MFSTISQYMRRHWRGFAIAVGLPLLAVGAPILSGLGTTNEAAMRTEEATRVVRTNEWLARNNLDINSSRDMMKALILACDEIRERGEKC